MTSASPLLQAMGARLWICRKQTKVMPRALRQSGYKLGYHRPWSAGELLPRRSEFVPLNHEPDSLFRSPHHPSAGDQFKSAAIFESRRPPHRHIHPGTGEWRLRTPQTHSSATHVYGFGANRRVPFLRLQDRVAGFPPKWESSRSTALSYHALIMQYI